MFRSEGQLTSSRTPRWSVGRAASQTRIAPTDAAYDWLIRSSVDTLTLEVVLGSWAGDDVPAIARRLGVSTSTVRRRLKSFLDWIDKPETRKAWLG